jgi:hypothetical protein
LRGIFTVRSRLLSCAYYDQRWAIGALLVLAPARAEEFIAPGGLWECSAMHKVDPWSWKTRIEKLLTFLTEISPLSNS